MYVLYEDHTVLPATKHKLYLPLLCSSRASPSIDWHSELVNYQHPTNRIKYMKTENVETVFLQIDDNSCQPTESPNWLHSSPQQKHLFGNLVRL